MKIELPVWLQHDTIITGSEPEGDGAGGNNSGTGGDGNGTGAEGAGSNDPGNPDRSGNGSGDNASGGAGSDDSDRDPEALKSALKAERDARKKAEREKKAADQKILQLEGKDAPDIERLTRERDAAATRVTALAEGFRNLALNSAIERAAAKAGFADPEDALALVDRSLITVDQEDDEPEKVEVDAKTVETAVKRLADKKKHLLKAAQTDGDGRQTGGQHGGGGKPPTQADRDAELRKRYRNL